MDGIINVYKEAGFTSHDVVAKLRGILKQKKIGHTGTLDPAATGVLPVCCGKATKVCGLLTDKDKSYRAVCRLGVVTDTQDMTGQVIEQKAFDRIDEAALRECIGQFQGEIRQIPPMYSAVKINGKKLYELAREGKTVERAPRMVTIHQITLVAVNLEQGLFTIDVTCSKGTYIRTLCHDIGTALGCGAAMESLIRTRVSCFCIEEAMKLDEIENLFRTQPRALERRIYSVDSLFPRYPRKQILPPYAAKLANGNPLPDGSLAPFTISGQQAEKRENAIQFLQNDIVSAQDVNVKSQSQERILVYDEKGKFRAIYQWNQKEYRVYKMF